MFPHVLADGPFRIDRTFTLPSGSFETVEATDLGNMSIISPATFEATQEGGVESLPLGEVPVTSPGKEQSGQT
jgi:hypothetical protein